MGRHTHNVNENDFDRGLFGGLGEEEQGRAPPEAGLNLCGLGRSNIWDLVIGQKCIVKITRLSDLVRYQSASEVAAF